MIEKFCAYLVNKIRKQVPDIDDEKAEIIQYGIQLIIGEIPKMFILFGIGFLFGIGWHTIFAYIAIMPYRAASGGFHLKSHLGCILGTSIFYYGTVILSKILILNTWQKYITILLVFIFGIIMITLYAPADTENVPILSKKERKNKKILSYIFLTLTLIASIFIKDSIISNILIIGSLVQTMSITRLAYILTKNKYGYEVYNNELNVQN